MWFSLSVCLRRKAGCSRTHRYYIWECSAVACARGLALCLITNKN